MNLYAAVILQRPSGAILLVREGDEFYWKLPGGKVEAGETFDAAAMREVQEELGLTLGITPDHSVGFQRGFGSSGVERTAIVFRRTLNTRNIIPVPRNEITEIKEVYTPTDLPVTELTGKILSKYVDL